MEVVAVYFNVLFRPFTCGAEQIHAETQGR